MDLLLIMKALADETRMRILNVLKNGPLCVCELEELLDINQSNASRHLNKLTTAKVLNYYKVSKYVYYELNPQLMERYPFIQEILNHDSLKSEPFNKDYQRLIEYNKTQMGCDDLKNGKINFNK